MEQKRHSDAINRYLKLNKILEPHGLKINAWGRLAIVSIANPHSNFIANNIDSMEEIQQWVAGFIYAKTGTPLNTEFLL